MASVMLKMPGSKWWIEYDDVTFDIIAQHNKADITATIQALREALLLLPDIPQEATDVQSVLTLIAGSGWAALKKARISLLIENMYQARENDPRVLDAARIQSRIDALADLRDRLV